MSVDHFLLTKHKNLQVSRLSRVGFLFVIVLIIVVLEGGIRKWISSDLTIPIIIARDILVFYGIMYAYFTAKLKFENLSLQVLLLFTFLVILLGIIQVIVGLNSVSIFLVGIRFWLLYLWFAFVVGASFSFRDMRAISKLLIWMLLLMTPLVIIQHFMPPDAFLNKQIEADDKGVFLVASGIVRVTGTFSFTQGYTTFLAVATPIVLAQFISNVKIWRNKLMPVIAFISLGISTVLSGSRGSIIYFAIFVFIYFILLVFYDKKIDVKNKMYGIILFIALGLLISSVFNQSIEANQNRFEDASQYESLTGRIAWSIFGTNEMYKNATIIGNGIGMGNNFSSSLLVGERAFLLSEVEFARTILEGGVVGFIFVALKFIVIFLGLKKSWKIFIKNGDILSIMLWMSVAVAMIFWPIIGQLTVNAFGYLMLGLALASLRIQKLK